MPETTFVGAGLLGQLLPEQIGGFAVFFLTGQRLLRQQQQRPARRYKINIELIHFIGADAAVGLT